MSISSSSPSSVSSSPSSISSSSLPSFPPLLLDNLFPSLYPSSLVNKEIEYFISSFESFSKFPGLDSDPSEFPAKSAKIIEKLEEYHKNLQKIHQLNKSVSDNNNEEKSKEIKDKNDNKESVNNNENNSNKPPTTTSSTSPNSSPNPTVTVKGTLESLNSFLSSMNNLSANYKYSYDNIINHIELTKEKTQNERKNLNEQLKNEWEKQESIHNKIIQDMKINNNDNNNNNNNNNNTNNSANTTNAILNKDDKNDSSQNNSETQPKTDEKPPTASASQSKEDEDLP